MQKNYVFEGNKTVFKRHAAHYIKYIISDHNK